MADPRRERISVTRVTDTYQVTVDDVFDLQDRGGIAIVGVHTGGVITSGDRATLRRDGTEIPVPEVIVEFHSPPGKCALFLPGMTVKDAPIGATLEGPTRAV